MGDATQVQSTHRNRDRPAITQQRSAQIRATSRYDGSFAYESNTTQCPSMGRCAPAGNEAATHRQQTRTTSRKWPFPGASREAPR
jgi:hypothetical protein